MGAELPPPGPQSHNTQVVLAAALPTAGAQKGHTDRQKMQNYCTSVVTQPAGGERQAALFPFT